MTKTAVKRRAMTREYGIRVFAEKESISNNTRLTGLNNNDIIIGKSGCGKTGGYVIPNIQNATGSLVISDTKGQLARRFRGALEAKGYGVYVMDFVNLTRSCGYNPMAYIRKDKNGAYREQDILSLSRLICPPRGRQDDPIWDQCAALYVTFLIAYCLEAEPEKDHNLIHVADLHRVYAQKRGDYPFINWVMDHPDSFAAKKHKELMSNREAEKMWSSVMGFVNIDLEPFGFREASNVFAAKKSFDIASLGRKKTALFVNVSDTDRTFDQMMITLYAQILRVLCAQADANPDGRLDVPVMMIMDDFAASGKIPDFDKIISVIRSRDISVSLILQSLSQLNAMYGDLAGSTILNNCDNILFLGSQDISTADYVANRAMLTPETVYMLPRDSAYLIRSGDRARLVKKIIPYSTVDDYEAPDTGIQDECAGTDKKSQASA